MAAILVTWPDHFEQTFLPPSHWGSIWNVLWLAQRFLRRRCLKSVDDGRTTKPAYTISSDTHEPKDYGELKICFWCSFSEIDSISHKKIKYRLYLPCLESGFCLSRPNCNWSTHHCSSRSKFSKLNIVWKQNTCIKVIRWPVVYISILKNRSNLNFVERWG